MESEGIDKRILLISNSTLYGSGYLDHAETEIRDFLLALNNRSYFFAITSISLKKVLPESSSVSVAEQRNSR